MSNFDGVALVTGAGGSKYCSYSSIYFREFLIQLANYWMTLNIGIGTAVATALVVQGCSKLVLVDISQIALEETEKAIVNGHSGKDVQLLLVESDIRSERSVDGMIKAAVDRFGAIHYCANCAGIMNEPAASLDTHVDDFLSMNTVNQRGVSHSQINRRD